MLYCERLFADLNRLADSPVKEKRLVRELAAHVMTLARAPRMAAIKQRWRDVIARRRPDRPPVWCKPVDCWHELLPASNLVCTHPVCRELEIYFKRLLIKSEIGDDTPINEYFWVNTVFDVTPSNTWGLDIKRESIHVPGMAWRYKPALVSERDFERLVVPRYAVNGPATEAARAERSEILGDSMPVRVSPIIGYYSGGSLCCPAADLRGMEPLMIDMIETPALTHRLMDVVCRGQMAQLDAITAVGNIAPNTDDAMFLSDPVRENVTGQYDLLDCWIHGNSQEFDMVGPEMFNEFLLDYQKKVFARFGAVCYGCCENLTHKLDDVLTIPNLRLLTCSAWTDLPTLVDKVQDRCCIMWRHKASDVVCPHDTDALEKQIRRQAEILKGCHFQVVLRELQTLMGHADRLSEWTRLSIAAVSQ